MMLLSSATLFLAVAAAREPSACEGFDVDRDPATGVEKLERSGHTWAVQHAGDATTWSLLFRTGGLHDEAVPLGHPVRVELEHGAVHELPTVEPATPRGVRTKYLHDTSWRVHVRVPHHVVHHLASSRLQRVRVHVGDVALTWGEQDRFKDRTAEAFGCVASRLPQPVAVR